MFRSILTTLAAAVWLNGPIAAAELVTTKSYAACADHEDVPVCLLQLVSRERLKPFKFEPQYAARPELLAAIEGATGENVSQFDEKDGYYRRVILPSQMLAEARLEALRLDAAGATPEQAIAPLLTGHPDYGPASLMLGQIEILSSAEERMITYGTLFNIARKARKDPVLKVPSDAFLRHVAGVWQGELQKFEGSGSPYNHFRSLAQAYAYLDDYESASQLMDNPTPIWRASLAIWFDDPAAAWQILQSEFQDGNGLATNLIFDILNEADQSVRDAVVNFILEEEFTGRFGHSDIVRAFFTADEAAWFATKLLETTPPERASEAVAVALQQANDQETLNALIETWKRQANLQPDGPCNSKKEFCPKTNLRYALARINRLDEAVEILDEQIYILFRDEITLGYGLPSTFDSLLESIFLVAPSLEQCARKRAIVPWAHRTDRHNIEAAATCANALVGFSQTPAQLEFESRRWELARASLKPEAKPTAMVGVGRYSAAKAAFELSATAAIRGEWEVSEQMLTHAFNLWDEAPEAKMEVWGGTVERLAGAMLEREGRFCVCYPR